MQCRTDCLLFVFSALLIHARLWSDNQVWHQLLRFWLLRTYSFRTTNYRLNFRTLLIFSHRECDRQQRTQTQSHKTWDLWKSNIEKKNKSAESVECKGSVTHFSRWRIFRSKHWLKLCSFTKLIFFCLLFFFNFKLKFLKKIYKIYSV